MNCYIYVDYKVASALTRRSHNHLSDVVTPFLWIKEETCLLIQSKNRFLSLHLCYKNDIFAKPLRHNGFANTSRLELGTFTIPLAMDGQNYEKSSMAFVAIRVP